MIQRAHRHFPRWCGRAQAFECERDALRVTAFRLRERGGQHVGQRQKTQIAKFFAIALPELLRERLNQALAIDLHIGMPFIDLLELAHARLANRRHGAGRAGVEGVEIATEALLARRLDQQRQVIAPIAGHHGVCASSFNLGDVGREIAHRADRVQVIPHDACGGQFARQHRTRVLRDAASERIILPDQINVFCSAIADNGFHQGFHAHVHRRVEAEMPETALGIGEIGVECGVVEEQHFLARIACVVFVNRVDQRQRRRRALALQHEADALVDGGTQLHQRLLCRGLVVERHDLDAAAFEHRRHRRALHRRAKMLER